MKEKEKGRKQGVSFRKIGFKSKNTK